MAHGMVGTKFYNCFNGIKDRCNNKNSKRYKNYGGRGIINDWGNFIEFKNDMYKSYLEHEKVNGGRNTSIDRINTNGNYNKDNCKWSTNKEQSINKTNTIIYKGTSLSEFCKNNGLDYRKIITRKNVLGWTIDEAIEGKRKYKSLKKPVLQFNLQGILIKEYESIIQACRDTGLSTGSVYPALIGKYKHSGGFIWRFKQ